MLRWQCAARTIEAGLTRSRGACSISECLALTYHLGFIQSFSRKAQRMQEVEHRYQLLLSWPHSPTLHTRLILLTKGLSIEEGMPLQRATVISTLRWRCRSAMTSQRQLNLFSHGRGRRISISQSKSSRKRGVVSSVKWGAQWSGCYPLWMREWGYPSGCGGDGFHVLLICMKCRDCRVGRLDDSSQESNKVLA